MPSFASFAVKRFAVDASCSLLAIFCMFEVVDVIINSFAFTPVIMYYYYFERMGPYHQGFYNFIDTMYTVNGVTPINLMLSPFVNSNIVTYYKQFAIFVGGIIAIVLAIMVGIWCYLDTIHTEYVYNENKKQTINSKKTN